jgi:hypothetical protein
MVLHRPVEFTGLIGEMEAGIASLSLVREGFTFKWNSFVLPKTSGLHPAGYRQLTTTSSGALASFSAGASTRNR